MSAQWNWLVPAWWSDIETDTKRSLAQVARVGLATCIALVAVICLRMGLLGTQRAMASTHNINPHCPPPPFSQIFTLRASDQVIRPGTEIIYTYTASNPSSTFSGRF